MAEGYRRGGCFRCGNPHHSQWECHEPLDQAQISKSRKLEHENFYLDNPEVKQRLSSIRQDKYFAKQNAKTDVSSVSWDLISNQAGSMLDFFLSREEQWFRIDGAKVGLDGQTSTVVLANARHVYEQIQSQLENVRLLTACAKAKGEGQYNRLQLEIIRGNVASLNVVRSRVHALGTRIVHRLVNLDHSITDLRVLYADISAWCADFCNWQVTGLICKEIFHNFLWFLKGLVIVLAYLIGCSPIVVCAVTFKWKSLTLVGTVFVVNVTKTPELAY
ncbi:hypothetical protein Fcan01_14442 [Folsomia candida]|uniref:CCHC-type domain-containing protein n=1 Tax=Folsomia candida TaxID=158441 RepID=A0A226E1T3_FOLCA|nr:hypothetical protein Fcan01_14442 [Folsomia candida]